MVKSTDPPVTMVMLNQAYHKGRPLVFSNFTCYLFFDDINIDLANYADDPTPYAYDLENEEVIKLIEKYFDKLFD